MKPVLQRKTNNPGKAPDQFNSLSRSGFRDTPITFAATHKQLDFRHRETTMTFVAAHKTRCRPQSTELQQGADMYVTPEQIQAASKSNVETFLAVANAQFA